MTTTSFGGTGRRSGGSSPAGPKWDNLTRQFGLEDFPDYDPNAEITSPRSLEACAAEGILPQELVYKPPEVFHNPDLLPEVSYMRYEFAESRRKDLLAVARATWNDVARLPDGKMFIEHIIDREGTVGSKTAPYIPMTTKSWFNDRLFQINPNACSPSQDSKGTTSPKSAPSTPAAARVSTATGEPVESRASPMNASALMRSNTAPAGALTMQRQTPPPTAEPGQRSEGNLAKDFAAQAMSAMDSPLGPSTPGITLKGADRSGIKKDRNFFHQKTLKDTVGALQELLKHNTEAPRTDRIEHDGTTDMKNHMMTRREREDKSRLQTNHDEGRLIGKRCEAAGDTYRRLLMDREEGRHSRTIRHENSLKPSKRVLQDIAKARGEDVRTEHQKRWDECRERVHEQVFDKEVKWCNHLKHSKQKEHEHREKMNEAYYISKFKVAKGTLEERIRFRYQHDEVCTQKEQYEAEKLRLFQKREEDMRSKASNAAEKAVLRKELGNLRDVNRLMTDAQRKRKLDYETMMKGHLKENKKADMFNSMMSQSSFSPNSSIDLKGVLSNAVDSSDQEAWGGAKNIREKSVLSKLARSHTSAALESAWDPSRLNEGLQKWTAA